MFVLLALVFAGGFVFLGVGSGNSGLQNFFSDVFNGGGGSGPSVSKALKATEKNPADAKAWRDLASAYETKNRTDDAIAALQRYTELRPKDPKGLADLGGLQLAQAGDLQTQASAVQAEQQDAFAATQFGPNPSSTIGKAFGTDPIQSAVSSDINTRSGDVYSRMQSAYSSAVATYQKLAKLRPNDQETQLRLAQAAESANQIPVAVKAYKRFVQIDPTNALVPQVKARIEQLQPKPVKKKPSKNKKGGSG